MKNLIVKSMAASVLIGLGDFVLLSTGGETIGAFLFSFGLLGVCYFGLNLFTGKCGFWLEKKIPILELLLILLVNLLSGYLIGLLFRLCVNGEGMAVETAIAKVGSWEFSFGFFLKACFCGMIMYLCVSLYQKGLWAGILIGVPLFIIAGFQHSIANAITMGIALTFDWSVLLAVLGNFAGSLIMSFLVNASFNLRKKEEKSNG